MLDNRKDCPCCEADAELHTSEGVYKMYPESMLLIEGLGWKCGKCGYLESNDGK